MNYNRLSNFYGIYSIIQFVHTKFIKVVLTDYSAFRSSSKMIEEQAAAAASQGKGERKKRVYVKPWLKKRKNLEFYGGLLAEFWFTNDF